MRRAMTVAELAKAGGLEAEDALLKLWLAGLLQFESVRDVVTSKDLKRVRELLGAPDSTQLRRKSFWMAALGLDAEALEIRLKELGLPSSVSARNVPKGAIGKLRALAGGSVLPPPVLEPPSSSRAVSAPFTWREVGTRREVAYISSEQVVAIHNQLVRDFARDRDPIDPPGVRSEHLLESAVFRQHTAMGTSLKYSTPEMLGAALLHALVHDHPFHNGNKRTALVSMLVSLELNDLTLTCEEDEVFSMVLKVSAHATPASGPSSDRGDRETLWIAEWIDANSRRKGHGDRPLQWRKLRATLRQFGCISQVVAGNRIEIVRVLEPAGLLRSGVRLSGKYKYTDEGREAPASVVREIRRDLRLDDDNGVDSGAFYQGELSPAGAFIVKYRRILQRLARL